MIRINLLQVAEVEYSAPTPLNPAVPVGGVAIASIIIVIIMYVAQTTKLQQMKTEHEKLDLQYRQLQPVIAELESLQQAQKQLMDRKTVIQQLENERLRYPEFMDDFIKLLPGNLWLTGLTTQSVPQASNLTVGMDVTALDNYAIADLIANLESSQIFADVDLGPITAATAPGPAGGQTMTFHLNTTYRKLNALPDANKKP